MHLTEGGNDTKLAHQARHRTAPTWYRATINEVTARAMIQIGGMTMRVTATATRTGHWWEIDVPEVAGGLHTQAPGLDQVAATVADAVALVADVSPDTIEVTVIPRLAQRDAELIDAARAAYEAAERAAERTQDLSLQAGEQLRSDGVTVCDVGGPLGVSPQQVP